MQLDLNKVSGNDGNSNLISILEIDLDDAKACECLGAQINSPRTLEAMAILGLEASELESVSYESVRQYYI